MLCSVRRLALRLGLRRECSGLPRTRFANDGLRFPIDTRWVIGLEWTIAEVRVDAIPLPTEGAWVEHVFDSLDFPFASVATANRVPHARERAPNTTGPGSKRRPGGHCSTLCSACTEMPRTGNCATSRVPNDRATCFHTFDQSDGNTTPPHTKQCRTTEDENANQQEKRSPVAGNTLNPTTEGRTDDTTGRIASDATQDDMQ
ncbi:MAG: hypothetical protein ACJAZO_000031 [Myxococcota bacterium]